jgi:3-oxoacyl-[acyl-carrier protein] reductase
MITYLRLDDPPDPGIPEKYRQYRRAGAEAVLAVIRASGGEAEAMEADLGDPSTPRQIYDAAEARLGPVDILVNNATGWVADTFAARGSDGIGRRLAQVSAETIEQQFSVDARGAALLIAEFANRHARRKAGWGRIIGLTSGSPQGFPGEVSYGAAKAALENYTMSAAWELADLGITANMIHPPITDTGWVTDELRRQVQEQPGSMHIARPEEVARVIAYLASDEAALITGNIIRLR